MLKEIIAAWAVFLVLNGCKLGKHEEGHSDSAVESKTVSEADALPSKDTGSLPEAESNAGQASKVEDQSAGAQEQPTQNPVIAARTGNQADYVPMYDIWRDATFKPRDFCQYLSEKKSSEKNDSAMIDAANKVQNSLIADIKLMEQLRTEAIDRCIEAANNVEGNSNTCYQSNPDESGPKRNLLAYVNSLAAELNGPDCEWMKSNYVKLLIDNNVEGYIRICKTASNYCTWIDNNPLFQRFCQEQLESSCRPLAQSQVTAFYRALDQEASRYFRVTMAAGQGE